METYIPVDKEKNIVKKKKEEIYSNKLLNAVFIWIFLSQTIIA